MHPVQIFVAVKQARVNKGFFLCAVKGTHHKERDDEKRQIQGKRAKMHGVGGSASQI